MSSLASAPLNDPAILKQALGFMDQLDDVHLAAETGSHEPWEGRPEQWCALLARLCQEQGKPMAPTTIARVVQAVLPMPAMGPSLPSGSVDLVGVDTPYQEHAEVPGWEWPPENRALGTAPAAPAMTWESFAETRRPVVQAQMEENARFVASLCGIFVTFITLFSSTLLNTQGSFLGSLVHVIGAGVTAAALPLLVGRVHRRARIERALRQQWEAHLQSEALAQERPAEYATWMKVPHIAAHAQKVSLRSSKGWRAEDVQALHRLLVEEERRRSRNLKRWRAYSDQPIVT